MDKTLNKLVLDIGLTVLFVLLIYPRQTGYSFHETAGLASGALVLFHLLLNWSWVKNVTRNLFNPRVKAKTKYFYLLNTVSLLALAAIIVTGVHISAVLFPTAGPASRSVVTLHKWLSYGCLALLGLHLALHWRFVTQTVPNLLKSPRRPSIGKVALNLGALVLTLGLLFTQSGFNSAHYEVASQTAPKPVYEEGALLDQPSAATGEASPVTGSNPRGKSRRHSSSAPAALPPPTSSISPANPGSDTSVSQAPATSSGTAATSISLTQYLGNLFCTGCSKYCSLLSPQCSIGFDQTAAAQQQYIAIYGAAD